MQGIAINRAIHRLRDASWLDLLKCAYFILIASFLAGLAVSSQVRSTFIKPGGLALVMMLFIAKDLVHAPEAFARLRLARAARQRIPRQLAALLPPGLIGWLRLEREMWRGCWAWMRRRPRAPKRVFHSARSAAAPALPKARRSGAGAAASICATPWLFPR